MNLKPFFQQCFYKKYFGIECPGCGFQRAFEYLINGDLLNSFKMYPPLITILIMLLLLPLHIIFSFKYGAKILLWLFIFNALIITVNYTLKFI